jgi:hypothetical protein
MLAVAGVLLARFERGSHPASEMAYFYDLSEQKLFTAPRSAIPPIPGLKGDKAGAVRAVVISTSGDADDPRTRKIAYLEKYSDELKTQIEAVRAGKSAEDLPREYRRELIFVKRPADPDWQTAGSPEGGKIMTEWQAPDAGGRKPVVCQPN